MGSLGDYPVPRMAFEHWSPEMKVVMMTRSEAADAI